MENLKGNITTIIKIVSMTVAGYLVAFLATKGCQIDEKVAAQLISTLLFFALSIIDGKYPNTFGFLDNAMVEHKIETEEDLINDEYE